MTGRVRLRRTVWTITALYWAAAFTMTHVPTRHLPSVPASDKVEHFLGYGLLAGFLFWSLRLWGTRNLAAKVLAVMMVYGMVDEWLQMLPVVGRSCEFLDWCADVAGAGTAVVIGSGIVWWLGAGIGSLNHRGIESLEDESRRERPANESMIR